ncbi:hypothetical protein HW555_009147 [Spodoptera exigua]|uniref:Uncharacterized protein n=1 Tax=Spodoptera exigua TaxID=7107 RepID=A0A835GDN3_SPOEX|nr:hypothetical protein HW555_009147 [Spodoptera exigua]
MRDIISGCMPSIELCEPSFLQLLINVLSPSETRCTYLEVCVVEMVHLTSVICIKKLMLSISNSYATCRVQSIQ